MTALLTETTRALGLSSPGGVARTAVGAVAIAALLVLVVGRDMLGVAVRAEPGSERARRIAELKIATVPLTLVFVGVVASRIAELLG
jgi:hypothetical protein